MDLLARQKEEYYKVNQGPVNQSKSKQLYSFPKSKRFAYKDFSNCSKSFYDIPSTFLTKKGVGIGYGGKTDFTKLYTQTPGAGTYELQQNVHHNGSKTLHSFGAGRAPGKIDSGPPPDKYQIGSTLGSVKYTMRPRNEPKIMNLAPGPGTYNVVDSMSAEKINQSKYRNVPITVISKGPDRLAKIPDNNPGNEKQFLILSGPQFYQPKTGFSPDGRYFISKISSNSIATLGKELRFPNDRPLSPGPGNYRIPGEFGIY